MLSTTEVRIPAIGRVLREPLLSRRPSREPAVPSPGLRSRTNTGGVEIKNRYIR